MARALVWFRDDLRLDDHPALVQALKVAPAETTLLHVFDRRVWSRTEGIGLDLPRLGDRRCRFWRESVAALRVAIQARGGQLIVRHGDPEALVPEIAASVGAETVFAQAHVTDEETQQEERVRAALLDAGRRLILTEGRTLLRVADLPFRIQELPDVFTTFRKKVEGRSPLREPVDAPSQLPAPPPDLVAGEIPPASDLGCTEPEAPRGALLNMTGGEAEGQARLQRWTFDADALRAYKETRNGLLFADESSKLSPWLAFGCLSPTRILSTVRRYEAERVANESTYWLVFELLWRDYFAFLALREKGRLFQRSGIGRRNRPFSSDQVRFNAWREGRTGFPFVDAFMRELSATGFMSNRGRQNVASFLAKSMGVDWRWGAAWFESQLIDYDPASNWGNWQYAAGVGTDPRDRVFNVVKQAKDYDPDAEFVHRWVPELRELQAGRAHEPWLEDGATNYPEPIVPPKVWEKRRRKR